MNYLAKPVKEHIRHLAMIKLIYYYGGFVVPSSFVCLRDIKDIYDSESEKTGCFAIETVDRNNTATHTTFFPNSKFMGCKKNNETVKEMMNYLEQLNSKDYTSEQDFLGQIDRWCYEQVLADKMFLVCGEKVGIKKNNKTAVLLDDLLSEEYVDIPSTTYGVYIPADEILKRTKYGWFPRMSIKQIFDSNLVVCKYLLLSN